VLELGLVVADRTLHPGEARLHLPADHADILAGERAWR
jgi:hypothetical protein